jgi:hypothetical protein
MLFINGPPARKKDAVTGFQLQPLNPYTFPKHTANPKPLHLSQTHCSHYLSGLQRLLKEPSVTLCFKPNAAVMTSFFT